MEVQDKLFSLLHSDHYYFLSSNNQDFYSKNTNMNGNLCENCKEINQRKIQHNIPATRQNISDKHYNFFDKQHNISNFKPNTQNRTRDFPDNIYDIHPNIYHPENVKTNIYNHLPPVQYQKEICLRNEKPNIKIFPHNAPNLNRNDNFIKIMDSSHKITNLNKNNIFIKIMDVDPHKATNLNRNDSFINIQDSPHNAINLNRNDDFIRFVEIEYAKLQIISARKIQKAWRSYWDRKIYKSIKSVLEKFSKKNPYSVMQRFNPKEAHLFDVISQYRIVYRLSGDFPPCIVYKIFSSRMGLKKEKQSNFQVKNELKKNSENEKQNGVKRNTQYKKQNGVEKNTEYNKQNGVKKNCECKRQNGVKKQYEIKLNDDLKKLKNVSVSYGEEKFKIGWKVIYRYNKIKPKSYKKSRPLQEIKNIEGRARRGPRKRHELRWICEMYGT